MTAAGWPYQQVDPDQHIDLAVTQAPQHLDPIQRLGSRVHVRGRQPVRNQSLGQPLSAHTSEHGGEGALASPRALSRLRDEVIQLGASGANLGGRVASGRLSWERGQERSQGTREGGPVAVSRAAVAVGVSE